MGINLPLDVLMAIEWPIDIINMVKTMAFTTVFEIMATT